MFPNLKQEEELRTLRRAAGEVWMEKLLNRHTRADHFPQGLSHKLENLFIAKYGGPKRARTEPFRSFVSTDHMQNVVPGKLDELAPTCTLAFVDLLRQPSGLRDREDTEEEWTEAELLCLLRYIVHVPSNPTKVIVFSCYVGEISSNITNALRRLALEDSVLYHCEYGTYSGGLSANEESRFLIGTPELVLFVGVSTEENTDWKSVFQVGPSGKCTLRTLYTFSSMKDADFDWHDIPAEEGETLAEEYEKKKDKLAYSAPTWDMAGMTGPGKFVNPYAKPAYMLMTIIRHFSDRGDTVFDFFSGGQVLKAAILCGRECFAFSGTYREENFIQEFSRELQKAFWFPNKPTWWEIRYDSRSYDEAPGTGGQEGGGAGETELDPDQEPIPNVGVGLDGRAEGAHVNIEEDDIIPPPPPSQDAGEAEVGNDHMNPANTPGQSTVQQDFEGVGDPLGNLGIDSQQSSTAHVPATETTKEAKVVNEGPRPLEADMEAGEIPGEAELNESMKDCHKASIDGDNIGGETSRAGSAEAGASNRTDSPNFCVNDQKMVYVSPNTGIPLVLAKPQTSGSSSREIGATGWSKKNAKHIGYKWTKGPNKNKIWNVVKAELEMAKDSYQTGLAQGIRLIPVWSEEFDEIQGVAERNLEIQSVLGELRVDEFGSHLGSKP